MKLLGSSATLYFTVDKAGIYKIDLTMGGTEYKHVTENGGLVNLEKSNIQYNGVIGKDETDPKDIKDKDKVKSDVLLEKGMVYTLPINISTSREPPTNITLNRTGSRDDYQPITDEMKDEILGYGGSDEDKPNLGNYTLVSTGNNEGFNVLNVTDLEKPGIESVDDNIIGKAGKVVGQINFLGIIISVIVLTIIGVKYMLGSIEEKAAYKETLKPYIIRSTDVNDGNYNFKYNIYICRPNSIMFDKLIKMLYYIYKGEKV